MIALLAGLAFVLSLGGVRAFLAVSKRRFVDQPGDRSSHSRPTPTGGGFPALIVFLIVSSVAVALGVTPGGPRWWAAAFCAGVLGLLGLLDDAFDLPRSARYGVHLLVAVAIVHWAGHPGAQTDLAAGAWFVVSVVFVTGLVNAFNFMDGIDALVGGTGVVIVAFFAWMTRDPMWLLLAASYSGFLVFNLPPARIFMGDAGSTALGGLIGVAILSGRSALHARHLVVLAPLMLDSAYTIVRRLIRRENIFRAHHSHIYQRLLRAGHSHAAISAGYAAATLVLGLLAVCGDDALVLAGIVGCVVAVVAIELYLSRREVAFTRAQAKSSSHSTHRHWHVSDATERPLGCETERSKDQEV